MKDSKTEKKGDTSQVIEDGFLHDGWILSSEKLPNLGDVVFSTDDKIEIFENLVYISERTCMMAGISGGYGYFGEGFATDGTDCDYGLICDTPVYWKLR